MILRYSRDILFRYPRAFFAFILELKAISFQLLPPRVFIFLYFSPPFTSHLFACYPFQSGSPPVYFLSIQLTSAFPSRCTHSIRSLFPPLFVIVFLSLIYLRFIFPLLVRFFYIYIYVSGYRGANRIPVWQTRLIFWKGRIFAKNRQNAVAIVD